MCIYSRLTQKYWYAIIYINTHVFNERDDVLCVMNSECLESWNDTQWRRSSAFNYDEEYQMISLAATGLTCGSSGATCGFVLAQVGRVSASGGRGQCRHRQHQQCRQHHVAQHLYSHRGPAAPGHELTIFAARALFVRVQRA